MASLSTHVIEVDTLREGYAHIVDTVRLTGRVTSPRGMVTHELLNPTIVLHRPWDALPTGTGRRLNLKIAAVEAVQLCAGIARDDLMRRVSPRLAEFAEENGRFWGAYGRRVGTPVDQIHAVIQKLRSDPSTRQAVITLWDPELDNAPGKRDYPCTVMLQFYLRSNGLGCTSVMRSNDAWLGLPYDMFQFGQLQCTIANTLGAAVGPLVHRPTSLHLYERDLAAASTLHPWRGEDVHLVSGFRTVERAREVAVGHQPPDPNTSERWYLSLLRPLMDAVEDE